MTEWGVVGVITGLVGLFVAVGKPILNLITAITKLTDTTEALKNDLDALTSGNAQSHARIFERLDSDDKELANHEARISVLEHDIAREG